MWGGLIAGALGGGAQAAGQIADDQIKQNQRIDLMRVQQEIEEQKLRYADELAKNRALWEVDTSPEGYATKKTAADTTREKSLQGVRTDAAVDQETRLAPIRQTNAVSQATAIKKAEGQVERENAAAYASDPNARAGTRAQARDKHIESAASVASAELHQFDLKQRKEMAQVLEQIDNETDPEKKVKLEDKFKRLSGGKYASRYEAVKVKDADGNEVTQILDKQTGFTGAPRTAPGAPGSMPAPKNQAEFDKLPKGTTYVAPDGSVRIKP